MVRRIDIHISSQASVQSFTHATAQHPPAHRIQFLDFGVRDSWISCSLFTSKVQQSTGKRQHSAIQPMAQHHRSAVQSLVWSTCASVFLLT